MTNTVFDLDFSSHGLDSNPHPHKMNVDLKYWSEERDTRFRYSLYIIIQFR
jgi:hypothetical protein